ncbi:MAG: tRNA (adenosine(37)-N6)-dimethylallyltransferase MiaA [Clostridiales bacterium]|nr:tRNA (adenosine(37)-N6)-dimethylallyltransferase MiaA [Clostridiales bacterium]
MVQEDSVKVVVITGPTAVGKSETAVNAALKFNGEVVSADSMQIYRHMDIGTGKITPPEMCGVPHHMLDVADVDEDYSVGRYVLEAKDAINGIVARGKLPIIVGGTGLYINSLLFNHSFAGAPKDERIRNELKDFLLSEGAEKLYERLKSVDPQSAEAININDTKRIIRALEIYEITGKPRSAFKDECKAVCDYLLIVLYDERELLYNRINARVDKMLSSGLVDEVRGLYKYKNCNSMQAIGYKEIVSYLDGIVTLEQAIEDVKQNSRRYAKRQMTYFRGMKAEKNFVNITDNNIDQLINKFI